MNLHRSCADVNLPPPIRGFASSILLLGALAPAANAQTPVPSAPISVEQAVREAIQHSPTVRIARSTLEIARTQADREKPVAKPTVTAIASGTAQGPRVDFPGVGGKLATVLPEAVGRLDLVLEQPLYRAGVRAAHDRYSAQLVAADIDFLKLVSELILSVRKACIDLLRSEAGVRASQDGVDAARRYQRLVQNQIAAGVAKPIDAQTVDSQVAEARVGLQQAEGGANLARYNLNRLLGRPLRRAVVVADITVPPSIPPTPDTAVVRALRARPELLLLDQNLLAARAGISLARAQSQPTVSARGQVTEQTPSAFLHEHYYAATLELRWPLSDGGRSRQDTREASAQIDRILALQNDARSGIELETVQAWETMRGAQARIELARTQRSGLEATELVAEKAYEVGRSTVFDVQSAQREVRSARAAEVGALYALHSAYADFLYAQADVMNGIAVTIPEVRL